MELDLNELERMAEEVQGVQMPTWIVGTIGDDDVHYDVAVVDCEQYSVPGESEKLAKFYAAANPAVVLELVRRLRDAEARVTARIDEAVEAEREACAKICTSEGVTEEEFMAGQMFAREIYARNQPPRGE